MTNNIVLKFFIFATFIASILEYEDNVFVGASCQYSPPLTLIELVVTADTDGTQSADEIFSSQKQFSKFASSPIKAILPNRLLFKYLDFSKPAFLEPHTYAAGGILYLFSGNKPHAINPLTTTFRPS